MTNTTNTTPSVLGLFLSVSLTFLSACTAPKKVENTNALIQETSPYLRQHAHNPVNWLAWNDKTLQKAKNEQKLMLISIGYAACHWCHVMEHETFSDTAVAKLMNTHYISVKIDREERPDIDNLYMAACQLTKENGCGWPLNIIALPNGKPVWVGTYTPKNEWIESLSYFVEAQKNDLPKLTAYAEQLQQGIQGTRQIYLPQKNINFDKSEKDVPFIIENILKTLDFENGGQKGSPKFPMPALFDVLLSASEPTSARFETSPTLITLDKIANSGIYDHLGGGFARYATDSLWQIPHFEKMLYDNGQLISLYSHAFQVTKKPLYEKVIRQTLDFIEQNWLSKKGGFYSSFDADTEGGEGDYYTWTKREIDSLLGHNATIFNNVYGITEGGNWEGGKNILSVKKVGEFLQNDKNLADLNTAKAILLKARNKHSGPKLDDKIITGWNALMLKGYIDAYKTLNEPKYLEIALKNAQFIKRILLQKDGSLYRHYTKNKVSGKAFLEDYAFTIQAFITLYEVTFDEKWLFQADKMTAFVLKNFDDTATGLFNFSDNRETPLTARPIPYTDDVIPNANASFALTLNHLGILLDKKNYTERAVSMMHTMYETAIASGQTAYYYTWAKLFLTLINPPFEVAIVGENAASLRDELLKYYLSNVLILGENTEGGKLPLLENKLQKGQTLIYVCEDKACKFPVKTVKEALKLINH